MHEMVAGSTKHFGRQALSQLPPRARRKTCQQDRQRQYSFVLDLDSDPLEHMSSATRRVDRNAKCNYVSCWSTRVARSSMRLESASFAWPVLPNNTIAPRWKAVGEIRRVLCVARTCAPLFKSTEEVKWGLLQGCPFGTLSFTLCSFPPFWRVQPE